MPAPLLPDRPPEGSPYASHIPALDGLRGLAALAVVCSHVFPGNTVTPLTRAVRYLFGFGATGVDLFFVLSGFLITGILVDSLDEPHFFRTFYMRRILRIFPLYYAVIAIFALAALLFGLRYDKQLPSMALYLQNTSLITTPIYAYAGPSPLPLSHFWSLAVEEQFYLVWPLLVFLLKSRRSLFAVCLGFILLDPLLRALLLLHGWGYYPVHENTFLRADSLLGGAGVALLLRSRFHDKTLGAAILVILAGAAATALLLIAEAHAATCPVWWPPVGLSLRYTSLMLLYAGCLMTALKPTWFARLLRQPALRTVGKYSYGLYVLHLLIFGYIQEPIRQFMAAHLTPNKAIGVGVTGCVCLGLSFLAAFASYQLFEKRFLRLKRLFAYRQQSAQALTSA